MRFASLPLMLLLCALPLALSAAAGQPGTEPLAAAAEEEPLEPAALESTVAPVSPSLAGANAALLFGAMGAAFGAVIALGRYHKKRRPIELGVLRERKP